MSVPPTPEDGILPRQVLELTWLLPIREKQAPIKPPILRREEASLSQKARIEEIPHQSDVQEKAGHDDVRGGIRGQSGS